MEAAGFVERAAAVADRCAASAAMRDRTGEFPSDEFVWLAEAGLLTAPLRRADGGEGLGVESGTWRPLLRGLAQIGRGSLPVGRVYEGHVNALQLIDLFASPLQRQRYAAEARAGLLFGVWNTEAADGVKLFPSGNGCWRMKGAKTFASGAGHVSRPFVNGALPNGGWQMCIVPMDRARTLIDPSFWNPLGMRASCSFRVDFSGVELTSEDLVGEPDQYYRPPWFAGGAIRFAAVQSGAVEALIDEARTYLRGLGRTDDPYQKQRLGELAALCEIGRLWLVGAAAQAERANEDPAAFVAYANLMRIAIESLCLDALRLTERSVGARGLLQPHPFERIHRDLTLYLRQPSPDGAQAEAGAYVLGQNAPFRKLWDHD